MKFHMCNEMSLQRERLSTFLSVSEKTNEIKAITGPTLSESKRERRKLLASAQLFSDGGGCLHKKFMQMSSFLFALHTHSSPRAFLSSFFVTYLTNERPISRVHARMSQEMVL
jgi:hypothetical protein